MTKKTSGIENKPLMRAFISLRQGSRTSPQESRDKRLRTDERVVAQELKAEELDGIVGEKTRRVMGSRGWYSPNERTSAELRRGEERRAREEIAEEITEGESTATA